MFFSVFLSQTDTEGQVSLFFIHFTHGQTDPSPPTHHNLPSSFPHHPPAAPNQTANRPSSGQKQRKKPKIKVQIPQCLNRENSDRLYFSFLQCKYSERLRNNDVPIHQLRRTGPVTRVHGFGASSYHWRHSIPTTDARPDGKDEVWIFLLNNIGGGCHRLRSSDSVSELHITEPRSGSHAAK